MSILTLAIRTKDLCHSLTSFIFTVILLSIVVGSLSSEIFYMSNNSHTVSIKVSYPGVGSVCTTGPVIVVI